ncbi:MAG: hypothetical protein U0T82_11470 [Bacteroidales bacterium]
MKTEARDLVEQELSKIAITAPEDVKVNFYTSMYHLYQSHGIHGC